MSRETRASFRFLLEQTFNREEEEGDQLVVPSQTDVAAHVPQNPDENDQRRRLAEFFMSPEGQIKKFDQVERINRTSRREVGDGHESDSANGGGD